MSADVTNCIGKIYSLKCDVTSEAEVLSAYAWIKDNLGGVDIFINNAGIMHANFLIGNFLSYTLVFIL